jgi:hypothetical protein
LEEEDAGRGPASAQRSLCRFLFSSSSVALLVFLTTPKVTLPPTPSAHNYWSTPTSEQQEEDGAELGLGLGQGQAVRLRVQHAVGRRQRTRSMHDSTRRHRPNDATSARYLRVKIKIMAVFSSFKIPKNLQDFPSHQIFGRMHRALNVGKKITNCTVCL